MATRRISSDSWTRCRTTPGRSSDVAAYKGMIAKAIVFKAAHRLTRPFRQVQAQLAAYVVALLARNLEDRLC